MVYCGLLSFSKKKKTSFETQFSKRTFCLETIFITLYLIGKIFFANMPKQIVFLSWIHPYIIRHVKETIVYYLRIDFIKHVFQNKMETT